VINIQTENTSEVAKTENSNQLYGKASLSFIIARYLLRALLRGLFKIEVRGLENLPRQGGYILAGNHLSWLDAFLMLAFAPAEPRIYFMANRQNMENPAWRKFFTQRIGGIIPIDQGQAGNYRAIARQVSQILSRGGVLGIFPEGDVAAIETGRILPLKKGIGYFAAQTGATIVPVAFSGTRELWLRKSVLMIVGKPVVGQQGGREIATQLVGHTAEAILAILPPPTLENLHQPKFLRRFFTYLFIREEVKHPVPE